MDINDKLSRLTVVRDFERCALEEKMSDSAKLYISTEACSLEPTKFNEAAFSRYRIRPRVLRDVSNADPGGRILGADFSCPIGVSPTGLHGLAHPEGERATVRGCCKENCVFIMSSAATTSIEDVSEAAFSMGKHVFIWMQVYIHKDRQVTLDLVRRAEAAGFSAIVVTVDTPNGQLWRKVVPQHFFEDLQSRFSNLPCLLRYLEDPSVTFEDLKWLTQNTKLPVIVKGILCGEDAMEAVSCGASAIYVSNHGGRALQNVVPTVDVLEEVVATVSGTAAEVYLDGGVRSGSDVFVSLALGADAVFVGRPAIWGLSVGGEEGTRRILQILREELFITMQSAGVSRIEDIEKCMIIKA